MRSTLLVIFLLLTNVAAFAQSSMPNYGTQIIPPSPALAAFERYGVYPVDYSSGLPQVNAPIYTIRQRDFSFPISLSFHASGRRANNEFSTTGAGWVLNCTGYISREIRGYPDGYYPHLDETRQQVYAGGNTGYNAAYYHMRQADMQIPNPPPNGFSKKDAEYDVYSYNVAGMSGKFIIADGQAVQLTQSNVQIDASTDGPFIITDANGIKYEFASGFGINSESTTMFFSNAQNNVKTGWNLSKITLLSGETINFSYGTRRTEDPDDGILSPVSSFNTINYHDSGVLGMNSQYFSDGGYNQGLHVLSQQTVRNYTICYLQNITFPEGQIVFNYENSTLLLNSIDMLSKSSVRQRSVVLNYITTPGMSANFSNNTTKSLQNVIFKNAVGQTINQYVFSYYAPIVTTNNENDYQKLTDWWGYANLRGNKTPIAPVTTEQNEIRTSSYTCTDCKIAAFEAKLSGIIKTITFPTGGTTSFEYEPNKYDFGSVTEGPGIRIKTIISDDGTGVNKLIKSFKYGENEVGVGVLPYLPNAEDFRSDLWTYIYSQSASGPVYGYYRVKTFALNPRAELAEAYQQPISYSMVTEYQQDAAGVNLGKIIYRYSVPEYELSSDPPKSFRVKYWTSAKLKAKEVYKYRQAQNDFQKIDEDRTGFKTYNLISKPQVRMNRNMITPYDDSNNTSYSTRYVEEMFLNLGYGNYFIPTPFYSAKDYSIESAVMLPDQVEHDVISDLGQVTTTTTKLSYDNMKHLLPTRTEVSTSTEELQITKTKYPDDYPSVFPTDSAWQGVVNLQDKHILQPVEVSRLRAKKDGTNERLIGSAFYTYGKTKPVPLQIDLVENAMPITNFTPSGISKGVFVKDENYKPRYHFDYYDDQLNLLQKHSDGGPNIVYIWGYGGSYPVAEIQNTNYAAVESALGGVTSVTKFRNTIYPSNSDVNNFLNLLRTSPLLKGSLFTTYTYDPLVGMTSRTDARGQTTYYEYDNFQRLKCIKDSKGNIINQMDYHYQNQ